jgi:hypothetical protein
MNNSKERKGKVARVRVRRMNRHWGEEEPNWLFRRRERRSADSARWARPRGATARPLDGGVLTRWGARAPARGPATAPWERPFLRSRSLGCAVTEKGEEREQ